MTITETNGAHVSGEVNALASARLNPAFELPGPLFDVLPTAIYVCDHDGLVLRYNRRAAELWELCGILGDEAIRRRGLPALG